MIRRNPLVFLLTIIITLLNLSRNGVSATKDVKFDFPSFTLRNLTLLGDSHLRNGTLGLTKELGVPSSSAGAVIYNDPVRFYDQESNTTASFKTRFTFSIHNINPSSTSGDGLTFFLSPNNQTLGNPGMYLGLVNSSSQSSTKNNKFIAVEFDTRVDSEVDDPNQCHLGFDVDSLVSIKTADPTSQLVDLKSGNSITCWIDYKNNLRVLNVFLSYSNVKPEVPILTVDVDLSPLLKDNMYVGFSGSTEGTTEGHLVENWSFETSGFLPLRPKSHPHNVSDSSVIVNPVNPVHPVNPVETVSDSTGKHTNRFGVGIGIAGPAFFFVALAVFGYISLQKWKGIRAEKTLKAELVTGPREFSYKELHIATKGFHSSRIIGRGAFGNIYKAFFVSSGAIAAVKRSRHSHEGKTEFVAELSIIACLRHKNLVQLQGWCAEKGEVLLVYEFMPNGSLDNVLYQKSNRGDFLSWPHRQNIAIGLASVLTYLHQECEQQVIHRDVKTSNIMLDASFNPRLGDFGLARLMDHDKSPVSTLTAGTMGYLAPEYLQYGKATEKTDVYSYGVVMLELACGMRPIEKESVGSNMVNLVDYVWGLNGEGRILEAVDKRLKGEFDEDEMRKLLLVGLSCAHPDSAWRPSMRRVFQILNNEAELVSVPKMKPTMSFSCVLSLDDIVSD